MADKRISQLIERVTIANNDVLPIVASGATTTNKVTVSTLQDWMQNNLDVGVTSIGITIGSSGTDINVSGSPITTSGNITINIPTASATNRGLLSSSDWTTFNNKLSSVGLTMPSAFTVTNSPLTANGTIAVTGAGTVSQYIRGDGSLADFPEAGGGGASVSYYLNGSVSQGTIGGVAYLEMNKNPVLGAGTNFSINANGYIASFITDAGDPSLLEIPGGNWNFESYFQASSGGGTPSFYIELYKVNSGGTATLIASNSSNPELIAFGTTTTAYFSTLAVPTTTLALTDRLAVRFYVTHSGRTITMHTENSNLCQVITTFTTGLTALNGLTAQVQNFATGTSGTDFAISSAGSTHTFNLPDASATARGVVSTNSQVFTGVKTFSNGLSLPAVGGSNQTTRLVNIGTIHEGSAGSNQIGFNNSNNIYFGKGLNNGGVISWNNAAVRYYTLPDADGTIALTSQIPANPVGGSGTINQIPKYTSSTTTIGNSNISDNGSDVVIASRTGISLSGQSILLTPNLGGTTNRIETTGGLPLALVTSGSSITLAAGGTTPQITLASTGAVTLTGALNGTSASFSGLVTINSDSGGSALRLIGRSAGDSSAIRFFANNNSTQNARIESNSSEFEINSISNLPLTFKTNDTTRLTIASTGAATFSSSVTASSFNLGNGQFLRLTRTSGGLQYDALGIVAGTDNTRLISTGDFDIVNGALTSYFKVSSTGAATFSSSVTANGIRSINGGVDATFQDAFIGVYSGNNNEQNAIQTAVSSAASQSGFRFQVSNGGGSSGRTNVVDFLRDRQIFYGNVGIGTTSPSQLFHVKNDQAAYTWSRIDNQSTSSSAYSGLQLGAYGNTWGIAIGSSAANSNALTFVIDAGGGNSERMRITSGGNVGIGTASPGQKLTIQSSASGTAPQLKLENPVDSNSSQGAANNLSAGQLLFGATGSFPLTARIESIYNSDASFGRSADLVFSGTNGSGTLSERMRITSGGNVGIGTSSPSFILDVHTNNSVYNTRFYQPSSSTSAYNSLLITGAMTSAIGYMGIGGSATGNTSFRDTFVIGTQSNHPLVFNTNDSERMRITSGGHLLVGKTALNMGTSGIELYPNGTSVHSFNITNNEAVIFNNIATGTTYQIDFRTNTVERGSISVTDSATSYNTSSDYRLKENVKPVENALSLLTQLKPCTFNFIVNPEEEVMGFLAHEVQEVMPQAIKGEKDAVRIEQVEVSPAELDEEGNVITEAIIEEKEVPVYQGIDHSKLVPLLVAAMQEQQEQIKSLTEQVEALKSQING